MPLRQLSNSCGISDRRHELFHEDFCLVACATMLIHKIGGDMGWEARAGADRQPWD